MRNVHERLVAAAAERVRGVRRTLAPERADVRQVETPADLISAAGLPRVDVTDTFALRLFASRTRTGDIG